MKAKTVNETLEPSNEIDVKTVPYKETPDHKKLFFKDRYNLVKFDENSHSHYTRLDDDEIEILEKVLGYNQALWRIARKNTIISIGQEKLDSKFENETPGYIGKFSGDLRVTYKGFVEFDNGNRYFKQYTTTIDTRGFW